MAMSDKPSSREEQREERDKALAGLRARRETFYTPSDTSLDEDAKWIKQMGPLEAAKHVRELVAQATERRNAMTYLYGRLRGAVYERDALEAALDEERKDREVAEAQRRLSDQALSDRCKERDEARKELRELKSKKGTKGTK